MHNLKRVVDVSQMYAFIEFTGGENGRHFCKKVKNDLNHYKLTYTYTGRNIYMYRL